MKKIQGKPLPLGVTIRDDRINFSTTVPKGKECQLLLYKKGKSTPLASYEMREEDAVGEVRSIGIEGIEPLQYEYNYLIDEEVVVDPYVRALAGRKQWNHPRNLQEHEVRGIICKDNYDWEGDTQLHIPYHKIIAYSLHVRGFTKHSSSKVKHKGTFAGVIEKIPYLKELGINQIHCMPVYEFDECQRYTNYWGYGKAYCFAPKSSYASDGNAVRELKDMVKACHKSGIEVVLEMPFSSEMPKRMMEDCLRYYMMEYHVDGFIVNPLIVSMKDIYADPVLKFTKIFKHQEGFQNVMRRYLKGDEGMVGEVIYWLKHRSETEGIYNYIANHSGFTLNDLVSYDSKHNEANGENNQDGPDYNYSWNCGAEGPSRKKAVVALRKNQMRNAFLLVLFAQGIPCILAGDEFANTQKGNNNVYCQDNPIGWLDWNQKEKEQDLFAFVKELISLRKEHPVFSQETELQGMDRVCCGIPDVSYHGKYAWREPLEVASRQLGVFYCGAVADDNDCYVAYNMHWLEHSFALPALSKEKKWYKIVSTNEGILEEPLLLENQREAEIPERTIAIFIGIKDEPAE